MEKTIYPNCPTFDMTCPYCLASGECIIDNPAEECEDFIAYAGIVEDEKDEEDGI